MGKKTIILAMLLIVAGVALILYQDPQFRFVYNTIKGSTASSASTTTRFTVGGGSSSSQTISTPFSATEIIESLAGAGLVGVGLVLVGIEIFILSNKLNV